MGVVIPLHNEHFLELHAPNGTVCKARVLYNRVSHKWAWSIVIPRTLQFSGECSSRDMALKACKNAAKKFGGKKGKVSDEH